MRSRPPAQLGATTVRAEPQLSRPDSATAATIPPHSRTASNRRHSMDVRRKLNDIGCSAAAWYAAEALLADVAGWRFSWRSVLLRDLLLPTLWLTNWMGNDFVWRGNVMRIADRNSDGMIVIRSQQKSAMGG